jgi:tetratricopeptide (TPR) repeat protein
MIAEIDPEQALQHLEPAIGAMVEVIRQFDGTITRVLGDGVMALFGAPDAHEEHALAACNAAATMHGAVAVASRGQVQIRVGINTGVVLVRSVGFDMSLDYDAIGMSVHMAARMEQLAPPGTTIISDSTYREVEGCVETEPLGRKTLKGAPLPVVVHRLIGVITETRWEGRAARHLTPFTGRERELAQLQAVFNAANAGASRIVTVVGEPGIGKSRLLHELLQASDMSAWTTLRTGSAANQLNSEYFAVGKLLREWMAQGEEPDLASALRHRLPDLNQNGTSILAALSYLLGSTVADEDWFNLEPRMKRRRAVEAFRYFVSAIGSTRPLAIVVEDLHWIDDASREILEDLASHLGTGRICIIGTTRNEESVGIGPQRQRIVLQPLDTNAAHAVLNALLGNDPSLDTAKKELVRRSAGTPLFLEEMARFLLETEASSGTAEDYAQQVPPTINGVIASRIDRLSRADKLLLQIASVIGNEFSLDLLASLAQLAEQELQARIDTLRGADFLRDAPGQADGALTFKHALIQEVSYETLLRTEREKLHSKIVAELEKTHRDHMSTHVEALAHHAIRGKLWKQAVTYLHRAGQKALDQSAHATALRHFRKALAVASELPDEPDKVTQLLDIRLSLRSALVVTGNLSEVHDNLQTAEQLARALDDRPRLAHVYLSQAIALVNQGAMDQVLRSSQQAYEIARETHDMPVMIGAQFNMALAHFTLGNLKKSVELFAPFVETLTRDFRYEWSQVTTGTLSPIYLSMFGSSEAQLGEFGSALAHTTQACQIAEETRRAYDLAFAYRYHGFVHLKRGDCAASLSSLRRGFQICRNYELNSLAGFFYRDMGEVATLDGNVAEALTLLNQAVQLARRNNNAFSNAWSTINLGWACLANGSYAEAIQLAREARDLARAHRFKALEPGALRLFGAAVGVQDAADMEVALESFAEAAQLAEELELTPEIAHCHLSWGEVLTRIGCIVEAREHIARALVTYVSHEMPYWKQRADRDLLEINGDGVLPATSRPTRRFHRDSA